VSLALGKRGQNARLAARLTGFKIDIKPESARDEVIATLNEQPVFKQANDYNTGFELDDDSEE
jgi:N utilization substance protein A